MFSMGPWQVIFFLVIALLLFGNRIPQVAKSLGKGITEFKKGVKSGEDEDDEEEEEELPKKKSKKKIKSETAEEEDEE